MEHRESNVNIKNVTKRDSIVWVISNVNTKWLYKGVMTRA